MTTQPEPLTPTGTNVRGALFSFLRVLAVALGVALVPFLQELTTSTGPADVPWWQMLVALVLAAVLTGINFLRSGEVRFGRTQPNVIRDDAGELVVDEAFAMCLGVAALVVLAVVGWAMLPLLPGMVPGLSL